jgi:RecA-family ATPase
MVVKTPLPPQLADQIAKLKAKDAKPKQSRANGEWREKAATGKDIRVMRFNPITYLVPDLIPNEGITLICAKPKVGKSWLLLDIAIAATMDRYVLGDKKPVQGNVLYLALEDSLRRIQSRMTKLLPTFTGEWPEGLIFATNWRRVDQGGLDDIREWAAETKAAGRNISFVAIDVLKMIRSPSKSGQPQYEADYEAIKGLHHLAIELGVPIIIVHHTRKAEAEDLIDKVSGTFGLSGAVDTIIVIERQSQGTVFDVRGD